MTKSKEIAPAPLLPMDPIQEYNLLKNKQLELQQAIKSKLEHQLEEVGNTLKILEDMGLKDILKDPQFSHHLDRFRPAITPAPTTKHKTSTPRSSNGKTARECILEAMAGGQPMGIPDITEKAKAIYGGDISKSTISTQLAGLKKDGKIKAVSRGQYVSA